MKKQLLFTAALLFATCITFGQNTWYDVDGGVTDVSITPQTVIPVCADCSVSITEPNPDAGDTANATTVTSLNLAAATPGDPYNRSFIINFPSGLGVNQADVDGLVITVRINFPSVTNFTNFDIADRFRLYLANDTGSFMEQVKPAAGQAAEGTWTDFIFNYGPTTIGFITSAEIRLIGQASRFTNLTNGLKFYIDTITANRPLTTDVTLSTNDIALNNASVSAYPNPVTNSFQLNSNKTIENVKLYNITGRLLKTFNAEASYDISDLATGLYIANIKTQSGSKTLRIIKK